MSFRKRNVGIPQSGTAAGSSRNPIPANADIVTISTSTSPGLRPSPVDGRLTTSTGTPSLDSLLAGHAGLALGNSLFIEESGTTDYTSALLRFYAAEGLVQGHKIHVVGVDDSWIKQLPGLVGLADTNNETETKIKDEKMKIAWRYERLGQKVDTTNRAAIDRRQTPVPNAAADHASAPAPMPFCHVFDLAKRLEMPPDNSVRLFRLKSGPNDAPFGTILSEISKQISASPANTIHRLVLPGLLAPLKYPPQATDPIHLLQFVQGLRGLLRQYANRVTAMITFPLELYPRSSALTCSIEHLMDGVLEFTPFSNLHDDLALLNTSGAATTQEERPQGMVRLHKLPIFHERGGVVGAMKGILGNDLAFTVSRRKFTIKPFSLPPAEGDTEAQQAAASNSAASSETSDKAKKLTKADIDF